jgi:hypothetical protein
LQIFEVTVFSNCLLQTTRLLRKKINAMISAEDDEDEIRLQKRKLKNMLAERVAGHSVQHNAVSSASIQAAAPSPSGPLIPLKHRQAQVVLELLSDAQLQQLQHPAQAAPPAAEDLIQQVCKPHFWCPFLGVRYYQKSTSAQISRPQDHIVPRFFFSNRRLD